MAIDYGNYAQLYGGGVDLSPIQKGISSYMEKSKEVLQNKVTRANEDAWAGFMKPWQDAMSADVGSWDSSTFKMKDAGTALRDYKADALLKGNKFYNALAAQGAFNPVAFKEQYDQLRTTYMPQIEKKLETYKSTKFLNDKDMKAFITKNNMNEFLLNYGNEAGNVRGWAMPKRTWEQWWKQKGGALGIGGKTALALGMTGVGYGQGARMYQRYKSPTGLSKRDLAAVKSGARKAKFGEGLIKGSEAKKAKKVSSSQGILTKAQKKYNTAQKAYKGKRFGVTKEAIALKKSITKAQTGVSTAKKITTKNLTGALNKAIKRHGKSKVIKMVAKKVGMKGAISLLAKTGLAVAPTGIGNIAGAGLLAADAYWIYSILSDLAE